MSGISSDQHYDLVFSINHSDYEGYIEALGGPDENAKLLAKLLDGCGLLVDVGANIGTISIPLAKSGVSVVAIEMNPANCLRLWLSTIRNQLNNISIIQSAASDHDGMIQFEGSGVGGYVSVAGRGNSAMSLRLDTILSNTRIPDGPIVVKIDVEGHEWSVLKGGSAAISTLRPTILFESIEMEGFTGGATVVRELVETFGYRLFLLRHAILSPKSATDIQEGHVVDYLALPAESRINLSKLGYEVRPLSDDEQLAWVEEMIDFPHPNHQRHAAGVLIRWRREERPIYRRAGALAERARALDHLQDVLDLI